MMNLFSALELGKNSILTQQQIFQVIGHNMANVNTPGYSRQVFDLENVRPSVIGLKDGGRGVELMGIRSVRDRFIDNQILDRKQYQGYYDTLSSSMLTVDSLFEESKGLGLSDSMSNFFKGWSDVANYPTDIPTRKSLVAKADSFTTQMNNNYQRLIDQQETMDANIAVVVDDINEIAYEIASLNQQIAYAEGAGNPANDLLDQRERRIRDLGEMVGVTVYYDQSNHSATVEVAGRPLVSFSNVNELVALRNPYNSNYYDVYITQYGIPARDITTEITNGKLGGLIIGRDGEAVNGDGAVSDGGMSGSGYRILNFSTAHGLSEGDLITINGETRSVVSVASTTSVLVDDFTNPIAANSSWEERNGYIPEYKKQLDKLAASLIFNVNAQHQQGYGLGDATAPLRNFFEMTAGGVNITAVAGNTVTFAADVSTTLSVGDVMTIDGETRLITSVTGNTATVNQAFVAAAGPAWQYAKLQGEASQIRVDPTIVSDATRIAASSQPTEDALGNPLAVSNNENALSIARLMDNNNTVDTDNDGQPDYGTFHEYLHSLFAEVGNAGNSSDYELKANSSMLSYLENKRDSISGVSLDEEAANLIQYEKSFQAIAQFMGKVSQLTDLLMRIV